MGPNEHSVKPPDDRRAGILDAAVKVIARDGMSGLKSAAVASESDVSTGLVHYYFPTLLELRKAALDFSYAVSERALLGEMRDVATGREKVQLQLMAQFSQKPEYVQAHLVWAETWQLGIRDSDVRAMLQQAWQKWIASLTSLIELAQEDGSIDTAISASEAADRLASLADQLDRQILIGIKTPKAARTALASALTRELDGDSRATTPATVGVLSAAATAGETHRR